MRKHIAIFIFALCPTVWLNGQTVADSLAIVSAPWEVINARKGVDHKRVAIPQLYRGAQFINLIEVDPQQGRRMGIAFSAEMKKTSVMAAEQHAIAAINGSYFSMKRGSSVCFLKVGKQVIDTTSISELNKRVTGAVYERKGKMKLVPWDRQIEKNYKGAKGTVLASGPLMLQAGELCDWSACDPGFIRDKHPRSAVGTTKEGKILLVTVDGRCPGRAEGVNIPELAHFMRVLGGKEALNLDGGGSTTLWLSGAPENGVVNCPSDNKKFDHDGERVVANILYIGR